LVCDCLCAAARQSPHLRNDFHSAKSSSDGVTWASATAPPINAAIFGWSDAAKLLIAATGTSVAHSSNGTAWTTDTAGTLSTSNGFAELLQAVPVIQLGAAFTDDAVLTPQITLSAPLQLAAAFDDDAGFSPQITISALPSLVAAFGDAAEFVARFNQVNAQADFTDEAVFAPLIAITLRAPPVQTIVVLTG
jgi:hypothetical protein